MTIDTQEALRLLRAMNIAVAGISLHGRHSRVRDYDAASEELRALLSAKEGEPKDAKDANRYRWLRSQGFGFSIDDHGVGVCTTRWGDWPFDTDEGFARFADLLVDEAIAKAAATIALRDAEKEKGNG
jgi:hypothetical protein